MPFIKILVVLLTLSTFMFGCDHSTPIIIGSMKNFNIHSPCGLIQLTGQEFSRGMNIKINFDGQNQFILNPKALKLHLETSNDEYKILKYEILMKQNNKMIPLTERLEINSQKNISIQILYNIPINSLFYSGVKNYLEVIPSGFIKCNGENLITDTIRIR